MKSKSLPATPVRFGNFKIWKARLRGSAVCVCVSELDGAWMIRIPVHFELGAVLDALYRQWASRRDGWERAEESLRLLLFNLVYVSSVANGYYQRAIEMLTACYANPSMLEDGSEDHSMLMRDAAAVRDGFLEWRKGWDGDVSLSAAQAEAGLRHEEIAEEAIKELVGGGDGG